MDRSTGYESFSAATAPVNSGAISREPSARGRRRNLSERRTATPPRGGSMKRAPEEDLHRPPKDLNLFNSTFRHNSRPDVKVPFNNRSPSMRKTVPYPADRLARGIAYGGYTTPRDQDSTKGLPKPRSRCHEKRRKTDEIEHKLP